MRYRLIGIDLDGTLLDGRGCLSEVNRRAVVRAQQAGVEVVPCTGRGWREAKDQLAALESLELGVFVTGASIARLDTGEAEDLAVIEPHLAWELVHFLADAPEAVLVFQEAHLAGHDYLVTGQGELSEATHWWFRMTGATWRQKRSLDLADLRHTLRVGLAGPARRLPELERQIAETFAGRVLVHHFPAVQRPDPAETICVMEIFAAGVDKWRGLSWIASKRGLAAEQIAAIGDEINDLSMLSAAGCGVAMGNGIESAKQRADHITRPNDEHGVAHALERMLEGHW